MAKRYQSTPSDPLIPRTGYVIAIDPGYAGSGCAVAVGVGGLLDAVYFEHARDWLFDIEHPKATHVIVEQPQQDARSAGVPPAILIKLAWEGAKLAGLYAGDADVTLDDPTVTEWKGSEAKPAMHKRLWRVLSQGERAALGGAKTERAIEAACEKGALCRWSKPGAELYPSTFKTHNLLDAASLLLWAYGRLEKVG